MLLPRKAAIYTLLSLLTLAACEPTTINEALPELNPSYGITQTKDYCERDPSCPGYADPDSSAPGIFLGLDINPDECLTTLTDDQDRDGFKDYCEQLIAEHFRPYLKFTYGENETGREPYWAVRFDDSTLRAHVFFAFAYYFDGGTNDSRCFIGPWSSLCAGHAGDSEWIELVLGFNWSTQHWQVNQATYSQHTSSVTYSYSQLEFPTKSRAYPAAYLAVGKHANYNSQANCDAGGLFGFDSCNGAGPQMRETFDATRNLGSSSWQLKNCVYSSGQFAGTGRQECFWSTSGAFAGWTGLNTSTTPYGQHLTARGF